VDAPAQQVRASPRRQRRHEVADGADLRLERGLGVAAQRQVVAIGAGGTGEVAGLPGKLGMDGSGVLAAVRAGELDAVRRYCETDVMNTYLVYLRFRLLRGTLSAGEYAKEVSFARERIAATGAVHWLEFLAAWDANAVT